MGDLVKLYNDYKDYAEFLQVYVREAHPTDEWQMKTNIKEDVCYAQPKNLTQRVAIANDFIKRFQFPLPFGVDEMSDAANLAYSAWPERIYIIDEGGRIVYRGGMGPFYYKPEEARAWLEKRFGPAKPAAAPVQAPAASSSSKSQTAAKP